MRVKLFLIVAIVAAMVFVMFGGLKQAHAYNLALAVEQAQTIQMSTVPQDKDAAKQAEAKAVKPEEIEPAGG